MSTTPDASSPATPASSAVSETVAKVEDVVADKSGAALATIETEGWQAIDQAKRLWNRFVVWFRTFIRYVSGWTRTKKVLAGIVVIVVLLTLFGPSRQQTYSMMPAMPSVPTWANIEDVNHRVEAAKPEIVKDVTASIEQSVPSKSEFAALQDEVDILRSERDSLDVRLRKLEAEKSPKRRR